MKTKAYAKAINKKAGATSGKKPAKMKNYPNITDKKWMPTLVWILCIVAIGEIMACVVTTIKRTPENILPHIYQILYSLISTKR